MDTTLAAGPIFYLHFDGSLFFNTYHNEADVNMTPTLALDQIVYFNTKSDRKSYTMAKMISIPSNGSVIYTNQPMGDNNIIQMPAPSNNLTIKPSIT